MCVLPQRNASLNQKAMEIRRACTICAKSHFPNAGFKYISSLDFKYTEIKIENPKDSKRSCPLGGMFMCLLQMETPWAPWGSGLRKVERQSSDSGSKPLSMSGMDRKQEHNSLQRAPKCVASPAYGCVCCLLGQKYLETSAWYKYKSILLRAACC